MSLFARARVVPGATKLFAKSSRRDVAIPIDKASDRVGSDELDQPESVQKVKRSHSGGRRGRSGSGALKGQNRSTISQLERAQRKPAPSSPKRRQNETKAETTGRQSIGKAPLNLRGPEATHSQREHTGLMDRGRGFEPICRARSVRKRAAPPLSVQRLEVPREPEREWRRVLMVRTPNTEVCICHSRCFKEI